ncbi:MAG: hypothetical protein O7D30_08425 [Rickettsia endosymbiont of Ixodes persulcatus]|nr:hypothetical protein [Rickettsia endosymbiont of Ixodes persulcatus]
MAVFLTQLGSMPISKQVELKSSLFSKSHFLALYSAFVASFFVEVLVLIYYHTHQVKP